MISPYKFKWDDRFSTEFNILTELAFDSDNGAVETHLSREAVVSETYNGAFKRVHNYKWSESFTFQLTIVKNNFGDFSPTENRQILKWLTGRSSAGFIDIYKKKENPQEGEDPAEIAFCALGNFVSVSSYKLGNGRVVGYIADWESCTPYAMSRLYTITKTVTSTSDKIIVNIDTDDNQPVCPRITIQEKGSVVRIPSGETKTYLSDMVENTVYFNGSTYYWKTAPGVKQTYFHSSGTNPNLSTTSVRFKNKHADLSDKVILQSNVVMDAHRDWPIQNVSSVPVVTSMNNSTLYLYNGTYYWLHSPDEMVIKNNTLTENIVIDCVNKVISSSSTRRILGDDFNLQWFELYDGANEITIEGNCDVIIEYRCALKVGEY